MFYGYAFLTIIIPVNIKFFIILLIQYSYAVYTYSMTVNYNGRWYGNHKRVDYKSSNDLYLEKNTLTRKHLIFWQNGLTN